MEKPFVMPQVCNAPITPKPKVVEPPPAPTLKAKPEAPAVTMSGESVGKKAKKSAMKLYVWKGVLSDHTDGMAFALATSLKEAVEVASCGSMAVESELTNTKPEVFDLNESRGAYMWGGG